MRRIFSSILGLISSLQKKHLLIVAGLVLSGSCFALEDSEVLTNIVVVLNLILSLVLLVITPAVILAGWLLSPDWTMGDFFGLRTYFLQVWVLVSNIVYIIFALLLLYMAIMQIFSGESKFAFKQMLPRFLIGILLVPFTWLIVSWTLSFANQAVAAVLSVPMGAIGATNTNDPSKSMFHKRVIPTVLSFNIANGQGKEAQGCKGGQTTVTDQNGSTSTVNCISPAEFVTHNGSGPFFIILIYAYDIFQINTADLVEVSKLCKATGSTGKSSADCIKDMMGIIRSAGLGLIVTVFFGILIIALCWVLLARALKLWIYVMFSPLFGLAFVSENGWGEAFHSEGGGGGGDSGMTKLGFVPFFKLAMVPVLVSAVLAFGLLFIGVMRSSFTGAQDGDTDGITQGETVCSDDQYLVRYCITRNSNTDSNEGYESSLIIGSDTADGGAPGEYAIQFKFGTSFSPFINDAVNGDSSIGALGGAVDSVESIFAHIIITMIALAIIWTGVQAAVQHDAVTSAAFKPFQQLGESTVHMIQHIPSMLPLPHPALAALTNPKVLTEVSRGIETAISKGNAAQAQALQDFIANPGDTQAADAIRNGTAEQKEALEKLGDRLLSTANGRNAAKDRLTSIAGNIANEGTRTSLINELNTAVKNEDKAGIKAVAIKIKEAVEKEDKTKLSASDNEFFSGVTKVSGGTSSEATGGTTVDKRGNVSGLVTSGTKPIKEVVDADLTPAQKSGIQNNRDKLKTAGDRDRQDAQKLLRDVGFGDVDENQAIPLAQHLATLAK